VEGVSAHICVVAGIWFSRTSREAEAAGNAGQERDVFWKKLFGGNESASSEPKAAGQAEHKGFLITARRSSKAANIRHAAWSRRKSTASSGA
jgi:hypothetical protein